MTIYFADTSALAKRYIGNEKGSAWLENEAVLFPINTIIIIDFTILEISSALMRRASEWSPGRSAEIKKTFLYHVAHEYRMIGLDSETLKRAETLVDTYSLRAGDAIQLAGALAAKDFFQITLTFMCSDVELLKAAAAEGFTTEDPETHP